jgi:hypothetical protein
VCISAGLAREALIARMRLPKETDLLDRGQEARISVTANSSDYGRLFFQAEVFHAGRLSERRAQPARNVPLLVHLK